MEANGELEQLVPRDWNGFCYLYEGSAVFGPDEELAKQYDLVLLNKEKSDTLLIRTKKESTKMVFIAGQPLNEPIVQHRFFVLGSKEDLKQTFEDYQEQKNGFECAKEFVSSISFMAKMKK